MLKRLIIWLLVAAFVYFFVTTIMNSQKNKSTGLTDGISQTTQSIKDKGKALLGGDKDDEYDFDKEYDDSRDAGSSSKNLKDEEETIVGDEDAAYDDDEDSAYDDDVDDRKAGSSSSKSGGKDVAYDDFEKKSSTEENKSDYDKSREIAAKRSYSSGNSGSSSSSSKSSSSSSSSSAYSSSEGRYLVVTGSYRDEVNAKEMVRKLRDLGYDGAEQFSFDFSEFYSVTAGRYASSSKAREIAAALEGRGISAYAHKMRSKFFED